MRVNSNKKIHKMKRDPYKTLLRTAGILAIVVVVGVGVFYLCSLAVTNDYVSTRNRIENENAEAELEFNAMMNELRAEQSAALAPQHRGGVLGGSAILGKNAERYPLAHRG